LLEENYLGNGRKWAILRDRVGHFDRSRQPRGWDASVMMKREAFPIANIYVPTKRRAMLNLKTVDEIAESILQVGQQSPILVRRDGDRFVLVEGLHRLEACKKLGESTIFGYLVDARKH